MISERRLDFLYKTNRERPLFVALLGPAASGKSELLRAAIDEAKERRWKTIHIDLRGAREIYKEDEFYEWLAEKFRQHQFGIWKTRAPRLDFTKILKAALTKSKGNVLVAMDHAEELCDQNARSLVATLREIQTYAPSQPAWSRLRWILAGIISIYELRRQHGSPNLQFALHVLPDMALDVPAIIRGYLRDVGRTADDATVSLLCELTRGEEPFLKLLIDHIPAEITQASVEDSVRTVLRDATHIHCLLRPVQLYQLDEEFRTTVDNLLEDRIVAIPNATEDICQYQRAGAICVDPLHTHKPEFRNGLVRKLLFEASRTPNTSPELTLLRELRTEVKHCRSVDATLRALRRAWDNIVGDDCALYLSCRESGTRVSFELLEGGIQPVGLTSVLDDERVALLNEGKIDTVLLRKGGGISTISSWKGNGSVLSVASQPSNTLFATISSMERIELWMAFLDGLCDEIEETVLRELGRYVLTHPPTAPPKKVFVSSTFLDLEDHRAYIMHEIQRRDLFFRGMENFGAASARTPDFIREQVRRADIYLGIFALRYGTEDPSSGVSMTELEYDEAVRQNKTVLCYVASDDYAVLKSHVEKDPEKLRKLHAFLARVKRDVVYEFKDISDLARQVYVDLGDPDKISL
ncbi:DUF4062 domain-containing protein [Acidicapsa acidisoli]|uniref:DUF4062 domain-containing protein n=1 Tax=Acidicapsa acidisoli TaxID=1615681 RepID=UPI0021DFB460|nr:DUF4062 domain-containing protein [Acidicapsa acidisoli]